ncbi:hypothetical protein ACFSNO_33785 [Streptomyces cirratus]
MEFVSSWCEVRWRIVRDVEAGFVELADDDLRVRAEALLGDNNDQAAGGTPHDYDVIALTTRIRLRRMSVPPALRGGRH